MKHSNITMQKVWDLNILDVADKLQIQYGPRGAYRKCRCFMHEDKNPSMWFKLSNNTWSCPVCQKGGGIVSLVEEHEGLKFHEAVDWLIREFGIYIPDNRYWLPARTRLTSHSNRNLTSCVAKVTVTQVPASSRSTTMPTSIAGTSPTGSRQQNSPSGNVPTRILPTSTPVHRIPAGSHRQNNQPSTVPAGSRYLSNPGRSLGLAQAAPQDLAGSQYLDSALLPRCLSTKSLFCQALVSTGILTHGQMLSAAHRYHLGITRDGGVIFWQIDRHQRVRDGKIMFYRTDCHRDHDHNPSSVCSRLIRQGRLPKDWKASHCLFGLHLLAQSEKSAIIAIVESEKTAVICSELITSLPSMGGSGRVFWLATGGKSNLTVEMLSPLKDCKIVIFPDTDPDGSTYRSWAEITATVSKALNVPIYISNILETHATPDQKARKIDIADYIIESKTNPQI